MGDWATTVRKALGVAASLPLSTRIRPDLKRALLRVCARKGLKVTAVVEQALHEKLEDIEDSLDLEEGIRDAEEMIPYRKARLTLKHDGIL